MPFNGQHKYVKASLIDREDLIKHISEHHLEIDVRPFHSVRLLAGQHRLAHIPPNGPKRRGKNGKKGKTFNT